MKSYCLLQLRGNTCAVELSAVKEVVPALPLAIVPLGPECLLGAANLRSEIVSIFALEPVLHDEIYADSTDAANTGTASDLSEAQARLAEFGQEDRFLILQHEGFTFGVRVRRVDTVRLPAEAEPLNTELPESSLLHPQMEFEEYKFRVIELDHLVQRLRTIMLHCFAF